MLARPFDRLLAGAIGAGDVHDVGAKFFERAPGLALQPEGEVVFRTERDGQGGDRYQIANRLYLRIFDRRRKDSDCTALVQNMADQTVERLGRPVADHVVIAAEQGNAKIGNVHRRPP